MPRIHGIVILAFGVLPGACSLPGEEAGSAIDDPAARVRAVATENDQPRRVALAEWISVLDSEDPAARMVASARLRRDTGMDFGYDATAPTEDRRAATDRWEAWYRQAFSDEGVSAAGDSADEPYNPRSQDADSEAEPSP